MKMILPLSIHTTMYTRPSWELSLHRQLFLLMACLFLLSLIVSSFQTAAPSAAYCSTKRGRIAPVTRQQQQWLAFSTFAKSMASSSSIYMDEEKEPTSSSVVSVEAWKRELLNLAASYDRGFGATATAREKVAALVQYLETANNPKQQQQQQQEFPTIATTLSTSKERTAGPMLSDNNETSASKTNTAASSVLPDFPSPTFSPLVGQWRMIWTTALDVLSLQASPFFTTGAIHQVYTAATSSSSSSVRQRVENSKVSRTAIPVSRVTNMIDFTPRVQALFPVSSSNSLRTLIRATVETRACRPYSYKNDSNSNAKTDDEDEDSATGTGSNARQGPLRIGLIFDSVSVQPIQLFGLDTNGILPPFGFDLPKIPQSLLQQFNNINDQTSADIGSNTANEERSPGYFDVTFLDDDFLVIRQNAPGGIFVLVRVDSIEP